MLDRINQLFNRLAVYPPVVVVLELVLIWIIVYLIFRFLRGTRAARMFKGLGFVLILISLLILLAPLPRIEFLYRGFLGFAAVALVVIFQPELRRVLVRLGEARLFRGASEDTEPVIEEIVEAAAYLSKRKIGAIIAIERDVPLGGIVDAGTRINAEVTAELLQTIFWPGSALHDMGVVIRGGRIAAAGAQFPLAEADDISQELGSRHRAGIGLSSECDAMVLLVSEETGAISIAERGQLVRKLSPDTLRALLKKGLRSAAEPAIESTPTDPPTTTDDDPEPAAADKAGGGKRSKRDHVAKQVS